MARLQRDAVICYQHLACDGNGLVAGKKQDRVGLIDHVGLGKSHIHVPGRLIHEPGGKGLHVFRCVELGRSRTGADGVAADVLRRDLDRHVLRKAQHGGFRRGVGDARRTEHAADGGHIDGTYSVVGYKSNPACAKDRKIGEKN